MFKLRVLLADDHVMFRDGLLVILREEPDMEVVAQAATGRETLGLVEASAPDVVVLDLSLPDMPGSEVARHILARSATTRVVALATRADPGYARRMLTAGVSAYVLKHSSCRALIDAIRTASKGGIHVAPELAAAACDADGVGSARSRSTGTWLSVREEEVLRAVAWGLSNKEIAADLGLSIKTVESYKAAGLQKLRLRTRSDIVRFAVHHGWLLDGELSG